MNKNGRKIALHRETLHRLEDRATARIGGGYSFRCTEAVSCEGTSAFYFCQPTNDFTCTIIQCPV